MEPENIDELIKQETLSKLKAERLKTETERNEIIRKGKERWFKGDNFWRNLTAGLLSIPILWAFATNYVFPVLETQKITKELETAKLNKEISVLHNIKDSVMQISDSIRKETQINNYKLASSKILLDSLHNKIALLVREKDSIKFKASELEKAIKLAIAKSEKIKSPIISAPNNCPFKDGKIVGLFGLHEHPLMKEIMVNNDGISILLFSDFNTYSINDGVVTAISSIPGSGKLVIIRSGEELYVYSNLESLSTGIEQGASIKRGEVVGKVQPDEGGNHEFNFQVWIKQTKVDPLKFISCKK